MFFNNFKNIPKMKKIFLFVLLFSGLMFFSCQTSKKEKAEIQALEQEIKTLDSVSVEIVKNKEAIEENVEVLDELLNELN